MMMLLLLLLADCPRPQSGKQGNEDMAMIISKHPNKGQKQRMYMYVLFTFLVYCSHVFLFIYYCISFFSIHIQP